VVVCLLPGRHLDLLPPLRLVQQQQVVVEDSSLEEVAVALAAPRRACVPSSQVFLRVPVGVPRPTTTHTLQAAVRLVVHLLRVAV
jgi:hypothetical protein